MRVSWLLQSLCVHTSWQLHSNTIGVWPQDDNAPSFSKLHPFCSCSASLVLFFVPIDEFQVGTLRKLFKREPLLTQLRLELPGLPDSKLPLLVRLR
jgi:hypothetical protein